MQAISCTLPFTLKPPAGRASSSDAGEPHLAWWPPAAAEPQQRQPPPPNGLPKVAALCLAQHRGLPEVEDSLQGVSASVGKLNGKLNGSLGSGGAA